MIAIGNFTFAQSKVFLRYTFTNHINGRTIGGVLEQYYANGRSIEIPMAKIVFKGDSSLNERSKTMNLMLAGDEKKPTFVLKMPESHSLVYAERIGVKKTILAVDSLYNFKWTVLDERKTINDEVCTKATTSFRGRNYVAWFKKNSSVQTGPWKFGGLPGLIYEINDDDELFTYSLSSIEFIEEFPVKLKLPASYENEVMLTHSEFITAWKNFKRDLEKDNDKVNYTLLGSNGTKFYVAPIKELY